MENRTYHKGKVFSESGYRDYPHHLEERIRQLEEKESVNNWFGLTVAMILIMLIVAINIWVWLS